MALPGITLSVLDGQLGLITPVAGKPLYFATSSAGTANTRYTFSRPRDVVTTLGQGPGVEAAAHKLDVAGGSIDVIKCAASVAAANSAVSQSGGGPTLSVAGTPSNFWDAKVRIRAGGALGTATFDYSLDGGKNFSAIRTVPAGGTFAPTNTGLTWTFAAGTYVADEIYSHTSTPATYNASDLTAAVNAALALNERWSFAVFTGQSADAATAASLGSAIDGHMASFESDAVFMRAIVDCGNDTTGNVDTDWAAVSDLRLAPVFGKVRYTTRNAFEGWGQPLLPLAYAFAARCAQIGLSTSPAWVELGSLDGVSEPSFDEAVSGETLHNKKINTSRTIKGRGGVYLTNGLLKSPNGSDFRYWPDGRVVDAASTIIYDAMVPYINWRPRTRASGAIDQRDAAKVNAKVRDLLRGGLVDPVTDDGTKGHVSAGEEDPGFSFAVDETNDLLGTSTLQADAGLRPRGQAEQISLTVGLRRQTAEA